MAGLTGDVRLDGRLFNVVNYDVVTVANEAYIHKLMRSTGLDVPLPFKETETDLEYQVRLQSRVIDTLKLPELLGGFLLPAGKTELDWSEAMAEDTAQYIRTLTNREARKEVFALAFQVNVYFFREGLASLSSSPSSSESSNTASPPEKSQRPAAH